MTVNHKFDGRNHDRKQASKAGPDRHSKAPDIFYATEQGYTDCDGAEDDKAWALGWGQLLKAANPNNLF